MFQRALAIGLLTTFAVTGWSATSSSGDELLVAPSRHAEGLQVAAGGGHFLVVWSERVGGSDDVFGRIIQASTGEPLGLPFAIASDPTIHERAPAVSFSGDKFLVAWSDRWPKSELRAARVSTAGEVLDPCGIGLVPKYRPTDPYDATVPQGVRLAPHPEGWLAMWTESGSQPESVFAARITKNGVLLDPGAILLEGVAFSGELAAKGNEFFATFDPTDGYGTAGFAVHADGTRGPIRFVAHDEVWVDSLASNGSDYLTTEHAYDGTSQFEIDGLTGFVREGTRTKISAPLKDGPWRQHSSSAFASGEWLVAHEEPGTLEPDVFLNESRVFAAAWSPRIAVTGNVGIVVALRANGIAARVFDVDAPIAPATPWPAAAPSPAQTPATTFGGDVLLGTDARVQGVAGGRDGFLVVSMAGGEVLARIAGRDGTPAGPSFVVGTSARPTASVASSGIDFMVAWVVEGGSSNPGYREVRASRITSSGVNLDSGGVLLASGFSVAPQYEAPAEVQAHWNGSAWVILWRSGYKVLARRMSPDGEPVDTTPILVTHSSPLYASRHGSDVVVRNANGTSAGAIFHADGSVTASPASWPRFDAMASNGTDLLLTYACRFECRVNDPPSGVYQPRIWSIEINGATHQPREPTRMPRSGITPYFTYDLRSTSAWAGRWVVVREEPTAVMFARDVFLDDTHVFEGVNGAHLAIDGDAGLVVAQRGASIVARAIHFAGTSSPLAATPDGLADAAPDAPPDYVTTTDAPCPAETPWPPPPYSTPTPMPTATPTPEPTPAASPFMTPVPPPRNGSEEPSEPGPRDSGSVPRCAVAIESNRQSAPFVEITALTGLIVIYGAARGRRRRVG